MTRDRLIATGVIVILVAIAGNAYLGFSSFTRVSTLQRQLLVSQKASTKTRVGTVTQRCELTQLILGVLVRVHDRQDAAPFQASYRICMKQLATVKAINAHTPNP